MADGLDLNDEDTFASHAIAFADRLSSTVAVVVPESASFVATISTGVDGVHAAFVAQEEREGITLKHAGKPILTLEVRLRLKPDSSARFLRVHKSIFHVTPFGASGPLFRYEYERQMERRRTPAAHVQFHGRHKRLEKLLVKAGRSNTRSASKLANHPNVTDIHFPVGGTRFRPCFEDVLEMLIVEFKLDVPNRRSAFEVLADERQHWRQIQLSSAVRDDPETAAAALRTVGYSVESPLGFEPRGAIERFRGL